jgi:hypothetical protein
MPREVRGYLYPLELWGTVVGDGRSWALHLDRAV